MSDSYFPVQYSILSSRALQERILSKYPLDSPLECHLFRININDVYVVNSGSATYYLRISRHGWRTREDIEEEIHLLNFLQDNNIPVSLPIKSRGGEYLQEINAPEGIRRAVLFSNAEGIPHDILNQKQCFIFGQTAGRMHRCTDKITGNYKKSHIDQKNLIEEPMDSLSHFLAHQEKNLDYLKAIAEELKKRLNRLPRTPPGYGICHGDFYAKNGHFNMNGNLTLFDFDHFGYGWRIYDIAVYVYHLLTSQFDNFNWMESFRSFISGYYEERELSIEEMDRINLFVLIRQIWGMGASVFLCKYRGRTFDEREYFVKNIELMKMFIKEFKIF
jgi:Ser/Thr protein kinase RdoA (MazF antagonist)